MIVDLTEFNVVAGTCDLLRQVTFCATLAQHRGEERLSIKQEPTPGCHEKLVEHIRLRGFTLKEWEPSEGAAPWTMDSMTAFPSLLNVRRQLQAIGEKDIPPSEFYRKWRETYALLHPTPETQQRLEALPLSECLGLHVRLTDKVIRELVSVSNHEIHLRQRNQVLRRTGAAALKHFHALGCSRVFLACDDHDSQEFWNRFFDTQGIPVILNRKAVFEAERFRQTSISDFLFDLFGLAECKGLVGAVNSGVPTTAALIGGDRLEDILWGRYFLPFAGLALNQQLQRLRRRRARKAVLEGRNHCPTFSFSN